MHSHDTSSAVNGNAKGLEGEQRALESNWADTVTRLLGLAHEASEAFDFERALDYLDTLAEISQGKELGAISQDVHIDIHQTRAKALATLGRHAEAIEVNKALLNYCDDRDHQVVRVATFNEIGQLLSKQGEYDRAFGYLQRAIVVQRRLDDPVGLCKALRNLSVTYVNLGELEEADLNLREAIDLASGAGEEILYADLVNNLGIIMNMRGDWRQALNYYRESLNIYRAHDQVRKMAYAENNLAITLGEQGMVDDAFEYFKRAHETSSQINDSSLSLIININLADIHLKRGELEAARTHCGLANDYFTEAQVVNSQFVETLKLSGKVEQACGQLDEALKYFDEALTHTKEIGARFLEADILLERGNLRKEKGDVFDALSDLEESYRLYTKLMADGKKEETEQVIDSIEEMHLQIFDGLAHEVDHKDPYTKGHSDRVAALALLLGKELGFKTINLKTLVAAGLLHDIGKLEIPDSVLKKPDKLTDEEYAIIQEHPSTGVNILRGKEFPWDVKPLILHHHEAFDGTGYPHGLRGEDIPIGARIICLADVFDALTSDRVYRKAFDTEKALAIMERDSGKAFDPVLLKCFCRMIRDGRADLVINSRTRDDELFSIWTQCMPKSEKQDKMTQIVK